MKDVMDVSRNVNKVRDIVLNKYEVFPLEKMFNILQTTGDKIVYANNGMAFG
jgi:hypothetical protein